MRMTWPPMPPRPMSTPSSRAASRNAFPSVALGSLVTGSSTSSRAIISPMPRTSPIQGWLRWSASSPSRIWRPRAADRAGVFSSTITSMVARAATIDTGLPP